MTTNRIMINPKNNPGSTKYTRGMILDGNRLTGDTYSCRSMIKSIWHGTWDAATKSWVVEPDIVFNTINDHSNPILRTLIINGNPNPQDADISSVNERDQHPCPHCGTYCYGDCQAH